MGDNLKDAVESREFDEATHIVKSRIRQAFDSLTARGAARKEFGASSQTNRGDLIKERDMYSLYYDGCQYGDINKAIKSVSSDSNAVEVQTLSYMQNATALGIIPTRPTKPNAKNEIDVILPVIDKIVKKKAAESLRGINAVDVISPTNDGMDRASNANIAANWIIDRYNLIDYISRLTQHSLVREEVFAGVTWDGSKAGVKGRDPSDRKKVKYVPGDIKCELIDGCDIGWETGKEYKNSCWWVRRVITDYIELCDRLSLSDEEQYRLKYPSQEWRGKKLETKELEEAVEYHIYYEAARTEYSYNEETKEKETKFVPLTAQIIYNNKILKTEQYDWLESKEPFVYLYYNYVPGYDRNYGLVRPLILPQTLFNTVQSRAIDYMVHGPRSGWVLNNNGQGMPGSNEKAMDDVAKELASEQTDGVRLVPEGYDLARESLPEVPEALLNHGDRILAFMEKLGSVETPPVGIDSAKALDAWSKTNGDQDRQYVDRLRRVFVEIVRRCLALWQQQTLGVEVGMLREHPLIGKTFDYLSGGDLMDEGYLEISTTAREEASMDSLDDFVNIGLTRGLMSATQAAEVLAARSVDPLLSVLRQSQSYAQNMIARLEMYNERIDAAQSPPQIDEFVAAMQTDQMFNVSPSSKSVGDILSVLEAYQQEKSYRDLDPLVRAEYEKLLLKYKQADTAERLVAQQETEAQAQQAGAANAAVPAQDTSGAPGGDTRQV